MNLESRLEELQHYYDRRAPEYEAIYCRPDGARKEELDAIADDVRRRFAGRRVLEVACGTGFWTQVLTEVAARVLATDASSEMIGFARDKNLSSKVVEFRFADAYRLHELEETFDAGVANFWLSHVPKTKLPTFLEGFHAAVGSGARVMMADNSDAGEYGGEFVRLPGHEDTFKRRTLSDGSEHLVLKNYFDVEELRGLFSPYADELGIHCGTYYWWVTYTVRAGEIGNVGDSD